MEPFYVDLTVFSGKERKVVEKEVYDRAVAHGATANEGRYGWGCCNTSTLNYDYFGVSDCGNTLFSDIDDVDCYGEDAVKLTIEQVRELYPLPEEKETMQDDEGWITLTCPEDVKNIFVGDLVRYKGKEAPLTKHYESEMDVGFDWGVELPFSTIGSSEVEGNYSKIQYKPAKNIDSTQTNANTPPVTENVSQTENTEENKEFDVVEKPSHYQMFPEHGLEVKDVLKRLLDTVQESGYDISLYEAGWLQQSLQYQLRFHDKNGLEDLKKAHQTLGFVIESMEQRYEN